MNLICFQLKWFINHFLSVCIEVCIQMAIDFHPLISSHKHAKLTLYKLYSTSVWNANETETFRVHYCMSVQTGTFSEV